MRNPICAAVGVALLTAAGAWPQPFSPSFIQKHYDATARATCLLTYSSRVTNQATGEVSKRNTRALGLLVSEDGLVMAHGHMLLQNSEPYNVKVTVGQGEDEKEYEATVLQKPDDVNVTFLQIVTDAPTTFPHVTFDTEAPLRLGDPLLVFGLLGEALDFNRTFHIRYIASVLDKPRTTYCLDAPVPFGSVGGAVVNREGKTVGVVGFDLSPAEGGELYIRSGHPLLYQAALFAKEIAHPPGEKEEESAADAAWLGVFTQPLTDDLAEYWGLPKKGGIVVSTLVPGAPAEKAGIRRGDVIVSFDGTPLRAKQDREVLGFTKLVREAGVGRDVLVRLFRDGQPVELSVSLAPRPRSRRDAREFEDKTFGLTVRELTRDVRIALNLTDDVQGVIVRRVRSGSWAALARIRPGAIVMKLGEHPVTTIEDFEEAVARLEAERPNEVSVFCRVGAGTGFFRMEPRWNNDE